MEVPDTAYTLGRWQPFGNHHFSVIDYFAEKYGFDEVYVGVLKTPGRSAYNPLLDHEVESLIQAAYEDGYTTDYDVETFSFGDELLTHREHVSEKVGDEAVFFTREKRWAWIAEVLEKIDSVSGLTSMESEVLYEPRDPDVLEVKEEEHGFETLPSSTDVRSLMMEDGEWKEYVSDSTVELLEGEYPEAVETVRAGSKPFSGKYQIGRRAGKRVPSLSTFL